MDQITYQRDRGGHFIRLQARKATDNLHSVPLGVLLSVWKVRDLG